MNATDTDTDTPQPLHERVELIVHLLKFSDRLFAIMSPSEEERRAFADLLMQEGGAGLVFARVEGSAGLDAEGLASELAQAWGIELEGGESAMQAIEAGLPERLPEPRRVVALIEDVQRLPEQALDELIRFMQRLDGATGGRARLVLLGGPGLADQLQRMPSLEAGGQVYALHLSPPPPEAFAGIKGRLANDIPAASPRPAPQGRAGLALSPRVLLIGGTALAFALAVIIALLLRPDQPAEEQATQLIEPLAPEPAPSAPPVSPPLAVQPPLPPGPAAEEGGEAPLAEAPVVQPPPAPPVEAPMPAPTPQVQPPAPQAMPEPAPAPAMPAPQAKPATPPAQPAQRPENWYAQQRGDHYVVQVISLKSAEDVQRFIRQHGLKDCHSFRQAVYGQTLHTLTCGLYPTREAAQRAIAELPEKARAGKPFPRRIDDIRKIMQP